jgi:L-threonylcarbamoyladenylate synthase
MKLFSWSDVQALDYIEQELKNGEVILVTGDTVLGLLANVSVAGALRLNQIKSRSEKPYLILVHDYKKALDLITIPPDKRIQVEKIMKQCWPGAVTLIFKAKKDVAPYKKSPDGTIAIRVPAHDGLLRLLGRFDALFSTSANSAGAQVPRIVDEVDASIVSAVAAIIGDDGLTSMQPSVPSTIIDCTGEQAVVVRAGAVPADKLLRLFNEKLPAE